jgi:membrane dipeptidase
MPANGGVVMVNFIADFIAPDGLAWVADRLAEAERLRAELNDVAEIDRRLADWDQRNPKPRGTVSDVANHIDNIRDVAGIDHIGIGSDYYTDAPDAMLIGLEDLTTYPNLFAELLSRGYTEDELKQIAGLNLLRAMRGMEETAARLQAEGRLVPYDRYGR